MHSQSIVRSTGVYPEPYLNEVISQALQESTEHSEMRGERVNISDTKSSDRTDNDDFRPTGHIGTIPSGSSNRSKIVSVVGGKSCYI